GGAPGRGARARPGGRGRGGTRGPRQLGEGGGAPRVGMSRALPFRTGLFVLAPEEPGHAQVVARLAIVARAADDVPEPGHGVVVTLERDGQTAGRLRDSDAPGETPEAGPRPGP